MGSVDGLQNPWLQTGLATRMSLADLPDDVLLLIFTNIEAARDLRALAISSRRLNRLVIVDGWRTFVRCRFPSILLPVSSSSPVDSWRRLAESLTWQSRCWDRRALEFNALLPKPRAIRSRRDNMLAAFQPVVDAHLCPDTPQELVVWGAGENIVARYRQHNNSIGKMSNKTSWHRADGDRFGYAPGRDDIRALTIVDQGSDETLGILAGRDNGDLKLLFADATRFGECAADFHPGHAEGQLPGHMDGIDLSQNKIVSLDVCSRLVAAATKTAVITYRLPAFSKDQATSSNVGPVEIYDVEGNAFDHKNISVGHAKWMGDTDIMALALRGSKEPLRYLTRTADGWSIAVASKNMNLERQFSLGYGNICPNSLQPVRPFANSKGGTSLLLSSWKDGTCRLQDLRTPSPFDAIYQDNIHPWAEMATLLTYGTERFIGGEMHGATLKVFDFRWTKGYYHTSGLPCARRRPFPPPPQPFTVAPDDNDTGASGARAVCAAAALCRWHALSRHIYYRPNATFFLSQSLPAEHLRGPHQPSVWSLAKAGDAAPNFYAGVTGGIIEASLEPTTPSYTTLSSSAEDEKEAERERDPNFGFAEPQQQPQQPWAGAGYVETPLRATTMETGDGLASPMNLRMIRLPPVYSKSRVTWPGRLREVGRELRAQHRLDARFHNEADFRGLEVDGEDVVGGVVGSERLRSVLF